MINMTTWTKEQPHEQLGGHTAKYERSPVSYLTCVSAFWHPKQQKMEAEWSSSDVEVLLSTENVTSLFDSVEAFLFDCDGVIWKGDTLIQGVPETLEMLRSKGKKIVFVTNNSQKSRNQYAAKFLKLGLEVTQRRRFMLSAARVYWKSYNLLDIHLSVVPPCVYTVSYYRWFALTDACGCWSGWLVLQGRDGV